MPSRSTSTRSTPDSASAAVKLMVFVPVRAPVSVRLPPSIAALGATPSRSVVRMPRMRRNGEGSVQWP
jgi:hypothetical protein